MFYFTSPTVENWIKTILSHRTQLLDTRPQMELVLDATREDVDKQFDENQSEWVKLKPYTVERKAKLSADPRILHETREGQGLRLRDAYKKAGRVEADGKLVYTYPVEKPYAVEHQEGVDDNEPEKPKQKGLSWRILQELKGFDEEFERKIHRDR